MVPSLISPFECSFGLTRKKLSPYFLKVPSVLLVSRESPQVVRRKRELGYFRNRYWRVSVFRKIADGTARTKINSIYWSSSSSKCRSWALSHIVSFVIYSLSCVWLFVTPWTVIHRLLCPWNSPGRNTGVVCHFLLQGIFPTQGLNPGLLHCMWLLTAEAPGRPCITHNNVKQISILLYLLGFNKN